MTLFSFSQQCFSDGLVNFPAYRLAEITKRFTDVYYMKFNFRGSHSGFKCDSSVGQDFCNGIPYLTYSFIDNLLNCLIFLEINAKGIVEHCDDLQYLFTSKGIPKIIDHASAEGQTVEKYTNLLYNFAKNG